MNLPNVLSPLSGAASESDDFFTGGLFKILKPPLCLVSKLFLNEHSLKDPGSIVLSYFLCYLFTDIRNMSLQKMTQLV